MASQAFRPGSHTPAAIDEAGDQPRPALAELPWLLRYLRVLTRWKWVIAGIITLAIVLGVLITFLMTPKYTATATIEISRQQDRIVQVQDVTPESGAADLEFYQTQYSLLKARSLADRVATDLKLASDPSFFRSMRVKIPGEGLFGGDINRPTASQRAERQRVVVDTLLDKFQVDPIRGSRLVEVSFTSPNAQLAQRIANSWTDHFIEANLARRFDATAYARRFLESRLEQLRQRLAQSERQLVAYAQAQRIVTIPAAASGSGERTDRSIVAEDLSSLNAALGQATAERVRAESRLAGAGSTANGATAEALSNGAITALRQRRAELASEYARVLTQFEPGYPQAQAIRRQTAEIDRAIAREEARVKQSVRTSFTESVAREQGLQSRVNGLKSDLLDLRRRSIQYNIYQRDVDTNRSLYEGLLARYKEIGIAGGVGTNNIAVVDAAQLPEVPSSPRLVLNLAIALLLGLVIAAATTFALEQIDEAIKDPTEAERVIGLPTLGIVPLADDHDPLSALQDRKSSQSEAYLSMQTNLQFSSDHGVPRSLAVTSTRPAEGKSTSAYAIALTLARTGRRIILIDGDMRSPSVHDFFSLPNDRGVSNYLAGDDGLPQLVQGHESAGLDIMTAGGTPPNAAELLTGVRLTTLIDRLLETYDHVIVDCPPVLGLADAPLIASKVEGVIYAVKARGARARLIRQAIARLRSANANLIGTVLTMFETKRAHYGYGYDYGYGYGSTEKAA